MSKISTACSLLRTPTEFRRVIKEKTFLVLRRFGLAKTIEEKNFNKSLKSRIKTRYCNVIGNTPNLSNPKKYTEKAQWRKIYCKDISEIKKVTDKAAVYDFVKSRIGDDHLLPILWVKSKITVNDIKELGDDVVLQPTHCSGQIVFIEDNDQVDHQIIAETLNSNTKYPYSIESDEPWYGYAKRQIMARPLIRNSDGTPFLNDCKIHVFAQPDGTQKFICEIINTYPHWRAIFSEKFERLNFDWSPDLYPPPDFEIEKPVYFDEMVRYASVLGQGFDCVRVDFMIGANEYYFTELTFAPAGGLPNMSPSCMDEIVGGYWHQDHGNWLKRKWWYIKTWAPLWRYERPIRNITRLYKKMKEVYVYGLHYTSYQLKYLRLSNAKSSAVFLAGQIAVPEMLAATNYYTSWIQGLRDNKIDAHFVAFCQNVKPELNLGILQGELLSAPFRGLSCGFEDYFFHEKPDIIFSHNASDSIDLVAQVKAKKPDQECYLFSGESLLKFHPNKSERKAYVSKAKTIFSGVVVVSEYLKSQWVANGFNSDSIFVTRTPVTMQPNYAYKGSRHGNIGRYFGNIYHKEIDNLLNICTEVSKEIPNFVIEIYGDGLPKDIEALHKKIISSNLQEKIILKKCVSVEEMKLLQSTADVLLLPREKGEFSDAGFPNKIGEYLASGCPTVCTDVGGISQVVTPGKHIRIVQPGDNNLFAEEVIDCLNNRKESLKIAQCGREFIKAYASPEIVAQAFLEWRENTAQYAKI